MTFSYVQFMTELMAPKPYPRQPNFEAPRLDTIAQTDFAIDHRRLDQRRSSAPHGRAFG